MTEQEFILVRDARSLNAAIHMLTDIVPDRSNIVNDEEYNEIIIQLKYWLLKAYEEICLMEVKK